METSHSNTNSLKALHRSMTEQKKKDVAAGLLDADQESALAKGDGFSPDPHLLVEKEGDNPRTAFCPEYYDLPDVKERIRSFAESYKRGDFVPPMVVQVVDGEIRVREGFRRRRGLLLAIAEGAPIKRVQVNESKGDEAKQALIPILSNDGEPLTPMGRAVQYSLLSGWNWTDAEIAAAAKKSTEHVRTTRALMDLPLELKHLIQTKAIAATYAAELFAEHGTKAVEIVKAGLVGAVVEKPGKKVTKKVIAKLNGTAAPRLNKKMVEVMRTNMSSITSKLDDLKLSDSGDSFSLTLSRAEVESLQDLREQMAKLEAAAKEASAASTDEKEQTQAALDV